MSQKVLIICQNFYPEIGSAANRMKNIYLELEKRGYEITVLTSEPSYPNRNLYKDSIFWQDGGLERNVIRFSTRTRKYNNNIFNRLLLYLEMCFKIVSKINRLDRKYDIVFATTPTIFVGLTGLFAKWKLRCPLILDVRDLWPESLLGVGVFTFKPFISLAYILEKKLYRGAKHIIVNSEGFIPRIVSKGVDRQKISFMPNSLTDEELLAASKEDNSNEGITVIYTGNIGLAQDLEILIEVAERMKDLPIKFKIIGYGFRSKDLKMQIEEKRLHNIEWINAK
ncbi:glycosyltransferase family 4 protein, partial [Paenibacillus forsythiae]